MPFLNMFAYYGPSTGNKKAHFKYMVIYMLYMYNIHRYMRRIIIADEIYMYTDDMYLHIKNNRVWFIDTTLSIRTFINTC